MLELNFAVYHRAVSLSSQAFSVDVRSIGWRIIGQTRLSSNTPGTPTFTVFLIQQSCISIAKKAIVLLSGSNHLVRLHTCKKAMGWCTAQRKNAAVLCEPLWKSHANLN